MSYTINLTNGNLLTTIPDGTINTNSTSLTLIGKNYAGYGQFLDDNFVHLLENSANGTQPTTPLTGQLWFNTTAGSLQVYNGTVWVPLASNTSSSTAPTNPTVGALWYDSTSQQLNVWTGTQWLLVGPVYTPATGVTGAIPAVITDTLSANHTVVELYVGSQIVGIISRDATFTPSPTVAGFPTISPGIQLATSVVPSTGTPQIPLFQGTATNSLTLNGVAAASYLQQGQVLTVPGLLNSGAANTGNIGNISTPFGTFFGTATNAQLLGGQPANSYINVNTPSSPTANISVNSILNSGAAGTGNIGNLAVPFGTIFATATSAQYADLAERFAADDVYAAGTVVELGGSKEITSASQELSDRVFGVISTQAAYLMNGLAGSDATHPPVAMTGRVPVRVTGYVNKGDRLVSAGMGIARAAQPGEATAFNTIGRALVSKTDTGLGTVEAIVTIK
jgi:hypothetical protein